GYGVGDKADHADHHVYDNWIENTNRCVSLSGFSDQELAFRKDIYIHDNVISQCDIAFCALRDSRTHDNSMPGSTAMEGRLAPGI
ncbi:hypothetical protein ACEQ6A_35270, partial [Rhizobium brockwellii]